MVPWVDGRGASDAVPHTRDGAGCHTAWREDSLSAWREDYLSAWREDSLSLSGVQEHCKLNNNYDNEHTNIIEHKFLT